MTEYVSNYSMCLTSAGDTLRSLGRLDESLDFLNQAQDVMDRLVSQNPHVDTFESNRADLEIVVASLLNQMGRGTEAARAYERALAAHEALEHKNGIDLYNMACAHCCLASLFAEGHGGPTAEPLEGVARHLDAAMSKLREAVGAGYRIARAYTTDPDLKPLRSRADFQLFVMDLTFPAQPFRP